MTYSTSGGRGEVKGSEDREARMVVKGDGVMVWIVFVKVEKAEEEERAVGEGDGQEEVMDMIVGSWTLVPIKKLAGSGEELRALVSFSIMVEVGSEVMKEMIAVTTMFAEIWAGGKDELRLSVWLINDILEILITFYMHRLREDQRRMSANPVCLRRSTCFIINNADTEELGVSEHALMVR